MANKIERDLRTSPQFKEDINELAHTQRITTSAMLRQWVTDYANGKPRPPKKKPETEAAVRIRVMVDPDDWEKAQARASAEGVSLSEELRKRAEAELAR